MHNMQNNMQPLKFNMQNMQNNMQTPKSICRIVDSVYFAYCADFKFTQARLVGYAQPALLMPLSRRRRRSASDALILMLGLGSKTLGS